MSITQASAASVGAESAGGQVKASVRFLFWGGVLLTVACIAAYVVQVRWANLLLTPWYLPIGGTAAALMVVYAVSRQRKWWRLGIALACLAIAGLEWHFVTALTALPSYTGPVVAGNAFPAFRAMLADGSEISESCFQESPTTAVVFFQGRWCPFCMTQLRELEARHEDFARAGAEIVVASIEGVEDAAQTQRDFPHLTVLSDRDRNLATAIDLVNRRSAPDGGDSATPTILLVDRGGTVQWLHRPTRIIARPSASELVAEIKSHQTPR